MRTFSDLQQIVVSEIGNALDRVSEDQYGHFCDLVAGARRIVCFGLGREGLAIRAFCMRLVHLGLDAHMAGDVTTLPIGPGDLLIVTSGPGNLSLTRAMIELGRQAGAMVIVVTAQPGAPDASTADSHVWIPAQTMADDRGGAGLLPMGTVFEIAMGKFFDLAVVRIQGLLGQSNDEMRARHFNLE